MTGPRYTDSLMRPNAMSESNPQTPATRVIPSPARTDADPSPRRVRPRPPHVACALFAGLCLALPAGAADAPAPSPTPRPINAPSGAPATRPADRPDAYVLHVPGIAGETSIDHMLVGGLLEGGFGGRTEIYDWTGENKGIAALVNRERNDQEARRIADKVIALRRRHPAATIMLTGHSGGTGLVVFALEKLPADVTVDGVLLLSPALSPAYDLSAALARVRGRMYVFSSTMDVFVLGLGTKVFGTIDRKQGDSAGRVGFVKPTDAADPGQYDKLVSCPYDKAWLPYGNLGDHVTVMSRSFSRHILTPLVLSHLPGNGGPLPGPVLPTTRPTAGATTTRPTVKPADARRTGGADSGRR